MYNNALTVTGYPKTYRLGCDLTHVIGWKAECHSFLGQGRYLPVVLHKAYFTPRAPFILNWGWCWIFNLKWAAGRKCMCLIQYRRRPDG